MYYFKYYLKGKHYRMAFYVLWLWIKLKARVKCNCPEGIEGHKVEILHQSRTSYHWAKGWKDPNGPWLTCIGMAEEDKAYWDDMWSEYYSQVM